MKPGDKVEARSPSKEQKTRQSGGTRRLSIGSKGTKSPMMKMKRGANDEDSDDEEGGDVGIGLKNSSSSSSSSSTAKVKYASAAKEEPDETGDDNEAQEEQKKDEDSQEARDLINSFKSMTGDLNDCTFLFRKSKIHY